MRSRLAVSFHGASSTGKTRTSGLSSTQPRTNARCRMSYSAVIATVAMLRRTRSLRSLADFGGWYVVEEFIRAVPSVASSTAWACSALFAVS